MNATTVSLLIKLCNCYLFWNCIFCYLRGKTWHASTPAWKRLQLQPERRASSLLSKVCYMLFIFCMPGGVLVCICAVLKYSFDFSTASMNASNVFCVCQSGQTLYLTCTCTCVYIAVTVCRCPLCVGTVYVREALRQRHFAVCVLHGSSPTWPSWQTTVWL